MQARGKIYSLGASKIYGTGFGINHKEMFGW